MWKYILGLLFNTWMSMQDRQNKLSISIIFLASTVQIWGKNLKWSVQHTSLKYLLSVIALGSTRSLTTRWEQTGRDGPSAYSNSRTRDLSSKWWQHNHWQHAIFLNPFRRGSTYSGQNPGDPGIEGHTWNTNWTPTRHCSCNWGLACQDGTSKGTIITLPTS